MKKVLNCLKKGIIIDVVFLAVFLLLGILIAHYTIHDTVSFYFKYRDSSIVVDMNKVISSDSIAKTKEVSVSYYTGSTLSKNDSGMTTYQLVSLSNLNIEKLEDDGYLITANKSSFNVSGDDKFYSDSVAKGFLKHLVLMSIDQNIVDEYNQKYSYTNEKGKEILGISEIFDNDYYNAHLDNGNLATIDIEMKSMIIAASIGAALGLVLGIVFCLVFIGKYDMDVKHEYDNEEIYRTPFHQSLWKKSLETFKDLKSLVFIAILLALVIVSKFLWIPSGFAELGIGFGYLFLAIACMLYGPAPALLIGALSDILGFLVKGQGEFFIGYTIQAMLACFSYGLLFYKTHLTFSRVLLARVFVNLVCNVIIGTICKSIISAYTWEQARFYMLTISLPKNLVYLLPQSLLLYFVLKAVTVPMKSLNLVHPDIADNVSFF